MSLFDVCLLVCRLEGEYAIDPTVDPAVVNPIPGIQQTAICF